MLNVANKVALFKGGSMEDPSNYRPISFYDIQTLRKTKSANQPHTYLESTDVLQDFGDIALIKLHL